MNVNQLLERLKEAAHKSGFSVGYYGAAGEYGLPVFERPVAEGPTRATIHLSTGIHGDEPAGPLAVLERLRYRRFRNDIHWFVLPCMNPAGLAAGTRENAEGIDLNRDYRPKPASLEVHAHMEWLKQRQFTMAICLHEDYEAAGFYFYRLFHDGAPSPDSAVLDAARPFVAIEMSEEIDEMPNHCGVMAPPPESHQADREDMPEALRLYYKHCSEGVFNFETPSAKGISDRIAAHNAAIDVAVDWLLEERLVGSSPPN